MAIDVDILSFGEYNSNISDINSKLTGLWNTLKNASSSDNTKMLVKRGSYWVFEGEEVYNNRTVDLGNLTGEIPVTLTNQMVYCAILGTVTGDVQISAFSGILTGVPYQMFLKQDATGGHTFRFPTGTSTMFAIDPAPNSITPVVFVKLPNGSLFAKFKSFASPVGIGLVSAMIGRPTITNPVGAALRSFTWTKSAAIGYGGTLTDLYSDWEIASDNLYSSLLFSSYLDTVHLSSIDVIIAGGGTVYMRTRYGGKLDGVDMTSEWAAATLQLGTFSGDEFWDQTVLCINASGYEGSRNILDEKGSKITTHADTKVAVDSNGLEYINFDGTGDYATATDSILWHWNNINFTLEFIFYPTTTNYCTLYTQTVDLGSNDNRFMIGYWSGKFSIYYQGVSPFYQELDWVSTLSANQINHVAFVRRGDSFFCFLNGALLGERVLNYSYPDILGSIYIGTGRLSDGVRYFSGRIYSCRFTKGISRYLSDFQVDLTNPYFKTGNLWWTPEPKEIGTDNFYGKVDWDKTLFCVNGGAGVIRDETNRLILTPIGNTAPTSGYINFDGTGDYITAPVGNDFSFPGDLTIECFISVVSSVSVPIFFITPSTASNNNRIIFGYYEGAWGIFANTTTTILGSNIAATALTTGSVHHVALVRYSGVFTVYVDGVSVGTYSAAAAFPTFSGASLYLGRMRQAETLKDLSGKIYGYRISDFARYTAAFTPDLTRPYFITKPKVENWAETSLLINALDLPSGSTDIRDFKGNAISVYGDTKVAVDSNGLEYINLDGSGDSFRIPASQLFSFGSGDFTIELFLKTGALVANQTVVSSYASWVGTLCFSLRIRSTGRIMFLAGNGSPISFEFPLLALTLNTLHSVVVCRKDGVTSCYIDGVFAGSTSSVANIVNTVEVRVGISYDNDEPFTGSIYSIRVIKGKALYTSNFAVDLTNPYFPAYENALADLWIDGNDYSKMTLVAGVSKIVDKSGNMREAVQAATARQPALVQNAQNGLMALNFDGVDDKLSVSSSYNLNSPKHIISVCKPAITLNWQGLVEKWNSNQGWQIEFNSSANLGKPTLSADTSTLVAPESLNGVDSIIEGKIDGPNSFIGTPGNLTTGTLSSPTTVAQDLFIGGDGSSTNVLGMNFYEIKLFLKLISDHYRNMVQGYLAHKWALTDRLPATHPYKTGFPVEDTRTDEYWYATVLCINGTDIIRPTEIVDSSRYNKITVYGDTKALVDSNNKPYINSTTSNFDGFGFLSSTAVLSNLNFTIEWFLYKIGNNANGTALYGAGPDNGLIHFDLAVGIGTDGTLTVHSSTTGATSWNLLAFTSGPVLANNEMYHVALVRSGGNVWFFVNGVKYAVSAGLGVTELSTNGLYRSVGQPSSTNRSLNGRLYSMRVTKGIARYTENFDVDLTNPYFPKKGV